MCLLDNTLFEHSLSNFHEASDVSTFNVVDSAVSLFTEFNASVVDAFHDEVKFSVNFSWRPRIVQIVFDSYNKILWMKGGDDLGNDFLSAVIDIVVDLIGCTLEKVGIDREGDECEYA